MAAHSSTGNALDTAANWSPDGVPTTSVEALLDNSILATLPTQLTLASSQTFGDLIWNSNNSSTILLNTSTTTNFTLTLSGGSTGAAAASGAVGGATTDLLVMGLAATNSTLTIGGNAGVGSGRLLLAIGKAGNFDVVNAGATMDILAAVSGAFALTKTGAGTLVFAGANTFGGDGTTFTISGGTVQLTGVGTLGGRLTSLADNANLDLGGTSQTVNALSGTGNIFNNGGGVSTLTIGSDFGGGTFTGVISDHTTGTGTVALVKIGSGTETINGAETYSGTTTVNLNYIGTAPNVGNGTLALGTSAGQLLNSVVVVNGATFSITDSAAGTVTRANGVTLNNGIMNVAGTTNGNSVDSITNALNLGGGRSNLTITPNSTKNVQLSAGSLTRTPGITIFVRGTNFGANSIASATANSSNVVFTTAPTLSGSGAAGTNTVGILAYAYGDSTATGTGTDFLTYDATNGLRRLTAAEYATTFASGNTTLVNAKITTALGVINSATSLNSLTLGTLGRINGTGTLTISSGGVLATDNASIGTLTAGTLDFGSAEGILIAISGKTLSIGSAITGSGGLTIGGPGTLVLTGSNAYSGGTFLSSGILNINGDAALGAVPGSASTNLTFSGGTLQAGAANVSLGSTRNITSAISGVNAAFDTNGNNMSVAGVISGVGGIYKTGNGTLTLSGASTFTGATYSGGGTLDITGSLANTSSLILVGGGVKLDFNGAGAPATNIINSAASLALNIGAQGVAGVNTLTIQGKDNAASSQAFGGGTDFANFASHLILTPGAGTGTLTVNLGAITRNTPTNNASTTSNPEGATLDITIPTGVTVLGTNGTPTGTGVNAIITGATVNGNTWAAISGSNVVGIHRATASNFYYTARREH